MAQAEAPRPRRLSEFAICRSGINYVWLAVKKDLTYDEAKAQQGDHPYAAHGGLVVLGDKSSGAPSAFHSTITIGPLQYVFFMRLAWIEKVELRLLYPRFFG